MSEQHSHMHGWPTGPIGPPEEPTIEEIVAMAKERLPTMSDRQSEQQWQILTQGSGYHIRKPDGQIVGSYGNPETGRAHHAFALQEIETLQTALAESKAERERLRSSLIGNNAALHNAGNDMEDMSRSLKTANADNAALRQQVEGLLDEQKTFREALKIAAAHSDPHIEAVRRDAARWNVVINGMSTKEVADQHFCGRLTEAADAILSAKTAPSGG